MAAAAPAAKCSFSESMDYVGHDLHDAGTEDQQKCCNLCASTPSCKFFAFRKSDRHCFMKDGNSGQKSNSDVVGGAVLMTH